MSRNPIRLLASGRLRGVALVALAALVAGIPGTQRSADAKVKVDPRVYDVRKKILGKSAAEWTVEWWQWVYSFPASVHPSFETDGRFVEAGQRGPVWFIGGGFTGVTAGAVRTATIPAGKVLLFPMSNVTFDHACASPPLPSEEQLRLQAAEFVATQMDTTKFVFTIDGKPVSGLETMRVISPIFSYSTPIDGLYSLTGQNCAGGIYNPVTSDGYWVFVKPLGPGNHVIYWNNVEADSPGSGITYNLTVVDHTLPTPDPSNAGTEKKPPRVKFKGTVDPRTFDNRKPVLGKSVGEWTAEWWQWYWSVPTAASPIADATGEFTQVAQHGPVWFLGAPSNSSVIEKTASIPSGTALLVPLLNTEWDNANLAPADFLTIGEMRQQAAQLIGSLDLSSLRCSLDGIEIEGLERYRVTSPPFDYSIPEDNLYDLFQSGQSRGIFNPAVSDGYWVFLKPLDDGPHTLHFEFRLQAPSTYSLDVTWHLNVVERSAP